MFGERSPVGLVNQIRSGRQHVQRTTLCLSTMQSWNPSLLVMDDGFLLWWRSGNGSGAERECPCRTANRLRENAASEADALETLGHPRMNFGLRQLQRMLGYRIHALAWHNMSRAILVAGCVRRRRPPIDGGACLSPIEP